MRAVQGELDTRSGVVYERDGFEVFYGLGGGGEKEVSTRSKVKLDGFDKFYGIRTQDKHPAAKENSSAVEPMLGGAQEAQGQCPNLSSSEGGRPNQWVAHWVLPPSGTSEVGAYPPPKVAPPRPQVTTYSVSTPVSSYVPPVDATELKGVDVFSVATPLAPPPPVPSLKIS